MIKNLLLLPICLLVAMIISNCSTISYSSIHEVPNEKKMKISSVKIPTKISGFILKDNSVIKFDSAGGTLNLDDKTLSGLNNVFDKIEYPFDTIQFVIVKPMFIAQITQNVDPFVDYYMNLDLSTVSYKDLKYPYWDEIQFRGKGGIINYENKTISGTSKNHQEVSIPFDKIEIVKLSKTDLFKLFRIIAVASSAAFIYEEGIKD